MINVLSRIFMLHFSCLLEDTIHFVYPKMFDLSYDQYARNFSYYSQMRKNNKR